MEREKRTELVQLRFTKSEKKIIEKLSAQERMTIAELIRSWVRNSAKNEGVWSKEKEPA